MHLVCPVRRDVFIRLVGWLIFFLYNNYIWHRCQLDINLRKINPIIRELIDPDLMYFEQDFFQRKEIKFVPLINLKLHKLRFIK